MSPQSDKKAPRKTSAEPPAGKGRGRGGNKAAASATIEDAPPRPAPKTRAAAKPRKKPAAEPATRLDPRLATRLRGAEMVLINENRLALAIQYAPGSTPVVLDKARGRDAESVAWAAQELGIPVAEMPSLESLDDFTPGEEIPEAWYRPIAHALALVFKTTPSSTLVRFVRPLDAAANKKREAWLEQVNQEFGSILQTPPIVIEMGEGLSAFQEDFREPMQQLRQRIAMEMGLLLAPIALRMNVHLPSDGYSVRLYEVPMLEGQIDLPVDAPEKLYVLVNRVKQLVYSSGWELLGYQDVDTHLALVRRNHPGLVKALVPAHMSVAALRQVLRNLLREQLSIRDLATILEVILDNLAHCQDPDLLTECVRMAYSRSLCHKYQDAGGILNVLVLNPEVERIFLGAIKESGSVRWLDLGPDEGLKVLRAMEAALRAAQELKFAPVLLVSPLLRRFISRLVEPIFTDLAVLSYNEIAPLSEVRSIGTVQF